MTELETDLREWMHGRAARVHASPKLTGGDYHPRTRALRTRLAISGGLAGAVAAVVAALSLTGGASNAFAGWTPTPTASTPAQRAAAKAYCTRNIPMPGLALKLIDERGPFTILVYSSGGANDFCTVGPSFRNASGGTSSPPVHPSAGTLFLWTDHTSTADGQSYGTMIARAGPDVRAVKLRLEDGTLVTATVEHGWVAAWWPGAHHVAAAQLTTPAGTRTQTFRNYPCDVTDCRGGPHGGAPGGGPGGG